MNPTITIASPRDTGSLSDVYTNRGGAFIGAGFAAFMLSSMEKRVNPLLMAVTVVVGAGVGTIIFNKPPASQNIPDPSAG